ncbi:MAG: NHL repeat-containing protein [Coriobacteriia bacterium]|nr:NHL repeat-containing protein [Coriobacteriia bacterium]
MSEIETGSTQGMAALTTPTERPTGGRRSRRGRRILIAVIIILLLSLCAIGSVLVRMVLPSSDHVADREESGGVEWIRSIYGWGPAENQLFIRPLKVEVGAGGAIYVTDQQYSFVMQFSPEGVLTRIIGEEADPSLYRVGAVAEGDGQLFFGQTAQDRVRVFSAEGTEESNFEFPSPNDIEFSGDRLAVSSNIGFVVFDSEGEFLHEVGGKRGEGDDEFDVISGVAYGPDGTLYITDAYNNRISAYDEDGTRLWMQRTGKPPKGLDITKPAMAAADDTTGTPRLQMPVDLVVDGNNRLVVVDGMDFSITVFDTKDGSFIAKYGAYGTKEGQLLYPTSIDYDPERDWFVVSDGGNRRVQILRITGSSQGSDAALGAVRRALAGPLRALIFPLLLLLLLIILWAVLRKRRRTGEEQAVMVSDDPDQAPGGERSA